MPLEMPSFCSLGSMFDCNDDSNSILYAPEINSEISIDELRVREIILFINSYLNYYLKRRPEKITVPPVKMQYFPMHLG